MIKITRKKAWAAKFQGLNIIIDRQFYKSIKDGQTIEITLDKGLHELFIEYDHGGYNLQTDRIRFREDGTRRSYICGMTMESLGFFKIGYNFHLWLMDSTPPFLLGSKVKDNEV